MAAVNGQRVCGEAHGRNHQMALTVRYCQFVMALFIRYRAERCVKQLNRSSLNDPTFGIGDLTTDQKTRRLVLIPGSLERRKPGYTN